LEQCFIPYINFFQRKHNNWYSGSYQGFILNAVGFFAFQPNESYLFSGLNENRFIVVWQEEDYDLPDKDGFGMEEYYNMFCVDEYYQLIPQIPIIYHVSAHDIQIVKSCHKKYMTMINEAKKVIEKRKLFPLWTEFI